MDIASLVENAEFVWKEILDHIIAEEALALHWAIRTGKLTKRDLFGLPKLVSEQEFTPGVQNTIKQGKVNSVQQVIPVVTCPYCQQLVSGNRFAPHLEKCLNGGKRSTKVISLFDLLPEKKVKAAPADPHPQSLIIRIKLKNQVPKPYQRRIGVSMDEYLETKRLHDQDPSVCEQQNELSCTKEPGDGDDV